MLSPINTSGFHRVSSASRLSPSGRAVRQQSTPGKGGFRAVTIRRRLVRLLLLYGFISIVAIPSLTWRFESSTFPTDIWRHTNDFVLGMNSLWSISALPSQPGVHVAQQEDDFACLLVLQDVCYSYNPGTLGPSLNRHKGVWFSRDTHRNLSKLDFSEDVCTLHKMAFPTALKKNLYMGDDAHDLPAIQQKVGAFVHLNEAQSYWDGTVSTNYSQPWYQPFLFWREKTKASPDHETIPVALISSRDSHLGHFVELVGGLSEVTRHLLKEPGEGGGDNFPHPVPPNVTLFFPLSDKVTSWTSGITRLLLGTQARTLPRKNHPYSICFQNALFLLNIPHTDASADHLRERAYEKVGLSIRSQKNMKLMESEKRRKKMIRGTESFGTGAKEVKESLEIGSESGGKRKKAVVNTDRRQHGGRERSRLEDRKTGKEAFVGIVGGVNSGRRLHENRKDSHFLSQALEEYGGPDAWEIGAREMSIPAKKMRKLQRVLEGQELEKVQTKAQNATGQHDKVKFQITLVQRLHSRTIANIEDIKALLQKYFPMLPVEMVVLEKLSFEEQIRLLHRTALYVSMHGASMSNAVLLRRGVTAIELFPYKFFYGVYRRICMRYGVNYNWWLNTRANNSYYANNCLVAGGYSDWPEHKCHTTPNCRWCVRDHGVTTVQLDEFRLVLGKVVPYVSRWLDAQHMNGV